MKFRISFVFALSAIFAGCGGTRLSVDPEWNKAPAKFTVLVSEPYVANSDDVNDDFGSEEAFKLWTVAYLDTAFSSYSSVSHTTKLVNDESFVIVQKPLGDGQIGVPLPVAQKLDDVNGIVVSIHPVRFWREIGMCHNRNGCMNNQSLNVQVLYSIVSLDDSKVLAYGGAYDKSSFTFAMTKGDWEDVIETISKKVVEKTPLEK